MKRILIPLSALLLIAAACATSDVADPSPSDQPAVVAETTDEPDEPQDTTTTGGLPQGTNEEPGSGTEAPIPDDEEEATDSHEGDEATDTDDEEEAAEDHDQSEGDDHGEFLPPAKGEPEAEIEVILTEMAFEPDTFEIVPGQTVRFVLVNRGVVEHEFRLSDPHRIEEHLASGHEEEDGHEEIADIFVLVEAGETRTIDVTFPDDVTSYTELACLVPGHYEAGMKGVISYTA